MCWIGKGWRFTGAGKATLEIGIPKCPAIAVNKIIAERGEDKVLLLYTYKINERYEPDLMKFRVRSMFDALLRRRSSVMTLQLSAPINGRDEQAVEKKLKDFLVRVFTKAEADYLP
jgi:hypothetical protein